MDIDSNKKGSDNKVLIVGLDNSGKSSIVLSMKGDQKLPSYSLIKPTIQKSIDKVKKDTQSSSVWEQGGQKTFRKNLLENFYDSAKSTDKIIFVIDVQDKKRYDEAVEYLHSILNKFQEEKMNPSLIVFLHKFDPELSDNPEYSDSVLKETLISKITAIVPRSFHLEVFKSTLYVASRKTAFFFD